MSKYAFLRCPVLVSAGYKPDIGAYLADFAVTANSAKHKIHVTADVTFGGVIDSIVIDYSGPCTAVPDTTGLFDELADFVRTSRDHGLVRFAVDFGDQPQPADVGADSEYDIFADLLVGNAA